MDCHNGVCFYCSISVGAKVEVTETGENQTCCICLQDGVQTKLCFPKCPHKHAFCVDCTRSMLFVEDCTAACPLCRHPCNQNKKQVSYIIPLWDPL